MTHPEPEKESPDRGTDPAQPDSGKPRELTPEEREELRRKIEQASKDDPNVYPVF